MLAMQYQITLPADYDMGIIRERVATRGYALDQYPGLGLKAYLIREAGVHGSGVNQYAPFYLWNAPLAAGTFLWGGDGFGAIVRDFGRPVAQTWVRDSRGAHPSMPSRPWRCGRSSASPTTSTRSRWSLREWMPCRPSSNCASIGAVPVVGAAPGAEVERYEVLHLSSPGLARLARR